MTRIPTCLLAFVTLAVTTPTLAVNMQVDFLANNPDGSSTYQISIESLPEISFLEMFVDGYPSGGAFRQNPGGPIYEADSSSPWKPAVVFSSDSVLASVADPDVYDADTDTFIYDNLWPRKLQVDLEPTNDGLNSMHVVMLSYDHGSGVGGPLPGGFIPLMQITVNYCTSTRIIGMLQSDSDQSGDFYAFFGTIPEPSSALLAGLGALAALISPPRRRR